MRKLLVIGLWLAGALGLPAIALAGTITIDFSVGTTGDLHTSTFTDSVTNLKVAGYYYSGASGNNGWSAADLYRRRATGENGFGVCDPTETNCSSGDVNEVDNSGKAEMLQLSLPAGYQWVSIELSSLDTNGGNTSTAERMEVFGDDTALPGSVGNLGATHLGNASIADVAAGSGVAASTTEPTIAIPSAYAGVNYLELEPYDWYHSKSQDKTTDNDFLLYKVTLRQVPEPTTMVLFGTGLALLLARRRRPHGPSTR